MNEIYSTFAQKKIIPAVKINDVKNALPLADTFLQSDLNVLEVTFRSDAAAKSIEEIAKKYPDILLGAGTVKNVECAKIAVECGAKFLVSPGFNEEVVTWCKKNNILLIPGIATPSEVEKALLHDINVLKFFPAQIMGGVEMLKALSGPYSECMFIPTGGINTENALSYVKEKNVLAVGGSWLCPSSLVDRRDFLKISSLIKEALLALKVN